MIHYAAFKLLFGLAVVGVVWSMRLDRPLNSSASGDRKTERANERTRHRRSDSEPEVMSHAERLEFLTTHNTYRNDISGSLGHEQPSAGGMMKMYWSAHLEASAVSWSMRCHTDLKHGQSEELTKSPEFLTYMPVAQYGSWIGQNLWKGGSKPKGSAMVNAFAKETEFFTFNEGKGGTCVSGKMCGHYTQVVWQTSFLVGCGYAKCGNVYIGTCNYMPGGNMQGSAPYKSGTACSLCASDKKYNFTECKGQLCVPKDRCSPVIGCKVVDDNSKVVDDNSNCLCSDSEYQEIVNRMVKAAGSGVGSPVVVFGPFLPLVAIALGQSVQLVFHSGLI